MTYTSQKNGYEDQRNGLAAFMDEPLYKALSSLIRQIYTDVDGRRVRTAVLTSTDSKSGVSYLSSCMSTLVAEELGTTVLADGQIIERLALKGQLPRRSDCTQVNNSQLWVLGATEANRLPCNEKGWSLPLGSIIEALVRDFDYVVVDAPALSASPTAEALSPYVDGAILVAVHNDTAVRDLAAARIKLTSRGGQVLGAIYSTAPGKSGPGETQ